MGGPTHAGGKSRGNLTNQRPHSSESMNKNSLRIGGVWVWGWGVNCGPTDRGRASGGNSEKKGGRQGE